MILTEILLKQLICHKKGKDIIDVEMPELKTEILTILIFLSLFYIWSSKLVHVCFVV